jgi:hypothetical protein
MGQASDNGERNRGSDYRKGGRAGPFNSIHASAVIGLLRFSMSEAACFDSIKGITMYVGKEGLVMSRLQRS